MYKSYHYYSYSSNDLKRLFSVVIIDYKYQICALNYLWKNTRDCYNVDKTPCRNCKNSEFMNAYEPPFSYLRAANISKGCFPFNTRQVYFWIEISLIVGVSCVFVFLTNWKVKLFKFDPKKNKIHLEQLLWRHLAFQTLITSTYHQARTLSCQTYFDRYILALSYGKSVIDCIMKCNNLYSHLVRSWEWVYRWCSMWSCSQRGIQRCEAGLSFNSW